MGETIIATLNDIYCWRRPIPGHSFVGSYFGRLVLTDQRLLFFSTGSNGIRIASVLIGALGRPNTSQLDFSALSSEGSLEFALNDVYRKKSGRRWDLSSYLTVDANAGNTFAFMTRMGWNKEELAQFRDTTRKAVSGLKVVGSEPQPVPASNNVVPVPRWPSVTLALIALNILVFFCEFVSGGGRAPGLHIHWWAQVAGAIPSEVLTGRPSGSRLVPPPFTVLTSMFIHGSWPHLLGNMVYLWVCGPTVEESLGPARFLGFYLASGVVAALTHSAVALVLGDPNVPIVGASGAISGVLAAYLLLASKDGGRVAAYFLFTQVGAWFLIQVVLGAHPGVAFLAHVGGFAFGWLVIKVLRNSLRVREAAPNSMVFGSILVTSIVILMVLLVARERALNAVQPQGVVNVVRAPKTAPNYDRFKPGDCYVIGLRNGRLAGNGAIIKVLSKVPAGDYTVVDLPPEGRNVQRPMSEPEYRELEQYSFYTFRKVPCP